MKKGRTKDPSEQLLLWGTLIILLSCGCYLLYQKDWSTIIKKEKKVEKKITYFDYGTLQGNQYCNTYFDFKITIPNNYKADYKWYDLNYTTFYEADTIPVIPTLPNKIEHAKLLLIEPSLERKSLTEGFKSNVFSETELSKSTENDRILRKLFGVPYSMSFLVMKTPFYTATVYDASYFDINLLEDEKIISGQHFEIYEGSYKTGDFLKRQQTKNILCFQNKRKGYYFNIILYYDSEEQRCKLLNMVDNIRFDYN